VKTPQVPAVYMDVTSIIVNAAHFLDTLVGAVLHLEAQEEESRHERCGSRRYGSFCFGNRQYFGVPLCRFSLLQLSGEVRLERTRPCIQKHSRGRDFVERIKGSSLPRSDPQIARSETKLGGHRFYTFDRLQLDGKDLLDLPIQE
jgi:hypothetical protein